MQTFIFIFWGLFCEKGYDTYQYASQANFLQNVTSKLTFLTGYVSVGQLEILILAKCALLQFVL